MRRLIFVGYLMVASAPAFADVTAICKLDKGTVTVAFTNPDAKAMQCEVNCDMAVTNGIGTVVCVKVVPGGTKDLVMCSEKGDGPAYTRVKGQDVNCRDPDGTPVSPAAQDKQQKDDDAEAEALMKRMQEQGLEMLKRMQKQKEQ